MFFVGRLVKIQATRNSSIRQKLAERTAMSAANHEHVDHCQKEVRSDVDLQAVSSNKMTER